MDSAAILFLILGLAVAVQLRRLVHAADRIASALDRQAEDPESRLALGRIAQALEGR